MVRVGPLRVNGGGRRAWLDSAQPPTGAAGGSLGDIDSIPEFNSGGGSSDAGQGKVREADIENIRQQLRSATDFW